jgi:RNA polymerase-binding transcription factor DksA
MAKTGKKTTEKKPAKPAAKPKAAPAKAAPRAKGPAPAKPVAKPAAKPVTKPLPPAKAPIPAPVVIPIPKIINSGPKEVIPAVAPKQVWRASNEAPPPKKKPGKGAPPPSIRDPRKEALEAMRQQQLAAERAANKGRKIDFTSVKSVASVAAGMRPDANGYVIVNGRRVRVIPTKAVMPKKKAAAAKPAPEKARDEGPTDAQIAAIKTRLSAKELADYKAILLQARAELIARVTGLEDDALRSSGGNLSNMPLHMADIGTDTFDQDLAIGMAETERELLREIDEALDRITAKTYGVCQLTGKPIPKARLDAKPWAKYTIEAARQLEKMGGR